MKVPQLQVPDSSHCIPYLGTTSPVWGPHPTSALKTTCPLRALHPLCSFLLSISCSIAQEFSVNHPPPPYFGQVGQGSLKPQHSDNCPVGLDFTAEGLVRD